MLLGGAVGGMSDQQKNFLGTIRFNAERMNTLVSDLNDVTKLQTDNLRMEFGGGRFPQGADRNAAPAARSRSRTRGRRSNWICRTICR